MRNPVKHEFLTDTFKAALLIEGGNIGLGFYFYCRSIEGCLGYLDTFTHQLFSKSISAFDCNNTSNRHFGHRGPGRKHTQITLQSVLILCHQMHGYFIGIVNVLIWAFLLHNEDRSP